MSLQVKGKLLQILNVQTGVSKAGNEWKKQEFVIETQEQFPKQICFTLFGDKISLLDGFKQGEELEVSFNLESREFNGRWFHNVNAWKIDRAQASGTEPEIPEYNSSDIPPEPGNDLPF